VRTTLVLGFLVFLKATGVYAGDESTWKLTARGQVATLQTSYTTVAYYVPKTPVRVLVLAHGFPWPDGTQSDDALAAYASEDVARWAPFAEQNHALVLAPAFGGRNFRGYRGMTGRALAPDEFVDRVIDRVVPRLIPHYDGRLSMHGHSAGAQFAARFLVAHPERLGYVILSAPSTYPMPDALVPWPFGMAKSPFDPENWFRASTEVAVTVLVGSQDTEDRPAAVGQIGLSRLERAKSWVIAMDQFAQTHGRKSLIRLVRAPGLGHDEAEMSVPAQSIFSQQWK
jgi:pimeloyl-ACP methyl ester carboxylesterase